MMVFARFRKLPAVAAALGVTAVAAPAAAQGRPALRVEAAPPPAAVAPPAPSLRAAVRALDTVYAPTPADGPSAPALLRAVAHVRRGEMDEARAVLLPLAAGTDTAAALARAVLGQVMLHRGEWGALAGGGGADGAAPLFAAFARAAPETMTFDADSAVLPMALTAAGTPVVEVTVNGRPHRFWVDTGAGLTVLSSRTAADVGLSVDGDAGSAGTGTSRRVETRGAVVAELRAGNAVARNHPVLVIDAAALEVRAAADQPAFVIDGILGWPFLRALDVTLDYGGGRMTVRRPVPRQGGERNFVWLGYPTWVSRAPNGRELLLGLDTGAGGSYVSPAFLDATGVRATGRRLRRIGSAGGFEETTVDTVPAAVFHVHGGWRITIPGADVQPVHATDALDLHGVVGSDVAAGGSLRIDGTNGRLELWPTRARSGGS